MKLSTRARYTLRMMIDMARHGGVDTPVSLASVAHRTDLSRGYLEQLATGLRRARLLRGVAGRKGGYRLARPASEIKRAAKEEGMVFLRESALERAFQGVTTLREINKVTFVD